MEGFWNSTDSPVGVRENAAVLRQGLFDVKVAGQDLLQGAEEIADGCKGGGLTATRDIYKDSQDCDHGQTDKLNNRLLGHAAFSMEAGMCS